MPDKDQDDMLREMAQHRGFRLVKSRRRKPGAGDYGKFGLADAKSGKECFGFGKKGLTATAEEIQSYLRSSEVSTWKQSVGSAKRSPKATQPAPKIVVRETKAPTPATAERKARTRTKEEPKVREVKPEPPPPAPEPEPQLQIRKAAKDDAEALSKLVRELGPKSEAGEVAAPIAAMLRSKEPVLVADRGGLLGCVAWHIIPALHRPPMGRITMILVTKSARRKGIGTALVEAAEARMKEKGCDLFEAVSDIDFSGAQSFFRHLGYDRKSYRFAKPA